MGYLIVQMTTSLVVAGALGFIAGWFARGLRGTSPTQEGN